MPVVAPSAMEISPWSVWMVVTPSDAVRQRRREHVVRTRAFVHRGGGEIDGGRGDGVGDVGGRRAAADGEALEVAAGDAGDVRRQAGGVV